MIRSWKTWVYNNCCGTTFVNKTFLKNDMQNVLILLLNYLIENDFKFKMDELE